MLCQPETEDFQKRIIDQIENNVKKSVPEILDNSYAEYLFSFVMYGTLHVLRRWIGNNYDTPTKELAELIYHSCNNVAR